MGAGAHQSAGVEHEDLVGVADRRDALGDDEHGGVGDPRRERGPQPGVGGEVERRERVVEHVDLGSDDERPGDRQPLSLSARHVGAALVDLALDAVGHRLHEVGGLGDLERLPQLVVGRIGAAEAEVRGDRAREQVGLLRARSRSVPTAGRAQLAHVDAVDEHRSPGGVEQPRGEADDRRLAGAGAADDRRGLAGSGAERDVVEHRIAGARIGERHVAELDRAVLGDLGDRVVGRVHGRFGVEHVDDPLGGNCLPGGSSTS